MKSKMTFLEGDEDAVAAARLAFTRQDRALINGLRGHPESDGKSTVADQVGALFQRMAGASIGRDRCLVRIVMCESLWNNGTSEVGVLKCRFPLGLFKRDQRFRFG